jgi:hypothetical protein
MEPLINILTRTSGRPIGFKRNVESVRSQTYKNIRHIVCTDDKDSVSYIEEMGITDYVLIDKENVIQSDTEPPRRSRKMVHNLYLNILNEKVTDGWIIYLDDDDLFLDKNSVQKVVKKINTVDDDTLVAWRMKFSSGRTLPINYGDMRLTKIGGSCIGFHFKYSKDAIWDSWSCSDFRVIEKLTKVIPKVSWLWEPIVYIPKAGLGKRKDA